MIPGKPFPKTIHYPDDLPVSQRRDDIAAAIAEHQVVIVSGETGSGKTTQLPKICLELGRGRNGMIGHTQPRRLAATSVARRVAQELDTPLGEWVGYQIRFTDKTSADTAIKIMTDGILLAESQRDPMLRRYDTIIIDEAHERSLNIDFLLGFLKQLLVKRPDLKLIITSATIDAQRFARHFSTDQVSVPVIDVSGRLYPVEIVYQPVVAGSAALDEDDSPDDDDNTPHAPSPGRRAARASQRMDLEDERDLVGAVVEAVSDCQRHGPGDILVFLPGEREIRETAEALERSLAGRAEVLPLYARLTRAAQERIFAPQTSIRRVVLATNVAETSLTVPGIRYVIDSGLARIKRYSWRNKVEQLHVERISQASANQRAGRCGRIGPGVCIRLYDEADFETRDAFTDPEILRSSLASVILRMKVLRLDDIDTFPFVDAPHRRAVTDGYQTLQELGALDDNRHLTPTGKKLARLPLDPRLARMILAAHEHDCLTEMLIIASALSVQDPRDRPFDARDAARQAHARFRDKQSEFVSYLNIWRWVEETYAQRETQRQFQTQLRKAFISPARMREWRDVHAQLKTLVRQQRWRLNGKEPTAEQLHTALLAGLLGNIGTRSDDGAWQGARGIRFHIHPGSDLAKGGGRWIMAGELVETSRLFARCVAKVEPRWIEKAGGHLIRQQWDEPRWEKRRGQVVANEKGILYGLTIYRGRRVHYGRIDPVVAREIFLREGLAAGEIQSSLPFLRHNRRLIQEIEALEHTSRRPDILVDMAAIEAFYDERVPEHIFQTATLERWYRKLDKSARSKLLLSREALMRHDASAITADVFPRQLDWFGVDMPLRYHFEPGSPRDGVTLVVPLYALSQVDEDWCEWLVPGMLKEKVELLIRSLPLRLRRGCVPIPDYAQGFHERWFDAASQPQESLLDALAQDILRHTGVRVQRQDFKPDTLPVHLHMNFQVVDERGGFVSGGRDLQALRKAHQSAAQASFSKQAARDEQVADDYTQTGLTSWTFGPLPEQVEVRRGGQTLIGYPALVDRDTHCDLVLFDDAEKALVSHKQGLRRLFRLAFKEQVRALQRHVKGLTHLSLMFVGLGTQQALQEQLIDKTIDQVCLDAPWPGDQKSFEERCRQGRPKLMSQANALIALVEEILRNWRELHVRLKDIEAHEDSHADILAHQADLIHPRFIVDTPDEQLQHFPRYLKGMQVRIDKLLTEPRRDKEWMADYQPLHDKYQHARQQGSGVSTAALDRFYWSLQELRVGLFAQELRTPRPVSVKRLERMWASFQV